MLSASHSQQAAHRAWRSGAERPFLLDNVRDLRVLLDHLVTRKDVDPAHIGMTGVSLGGMHTWLCAALDPRVAAAAPIIGVQSFCWAAENEWYHGRVESLSAAFERMCADAGKVHSGSAGMCALSESAVSCCTCVCLASPCACHLHQPAHGGR